MPATNGQTVQRRVLIVDDDSFQRELLKELLAQMGWRDVSACDGGAQALETVSRSGATSFGLMLIDLHMPSMDGFEFMGKLEAAGFRGRVIIVAGQSSEVLHSASLVAQLRRFTLLGTLPKPVQKSALRSLLATAS